MTNESSSLPLLNDVTSENAANFINSNDLSAKAALISVIDLDSEGVPTPLSASSSSSLSKPDVAEAATKSTSDDTSGERRKLSSLSDEGIKLDEHVDELKPDKDDVIELEPESNATERVADASANRTSFINAGTTTNDVLNAISDVEATTTITTASQSINHAPLNDQAKPDEMEMDLEMNDYDFTGTLDDKASEMEPSENSSGGGQKQADSGSRPLQDESLCQTASSTFPPAAAAAAENASSSAAAHAEHVDAPAASTSTDHQMNDLKPSVNERSDDALKMATGFEPNKSQELAKVIQQHHNHGHKRKLDENIIDFMSEDDADCLLGNAGYDEEDVNLKSSKHAKISTSVETIDSNESLAIGTSSSTNCPGSNNSSFGLEEKCTISSSGFEDDMSKHQQQQQHQQQPPPAPGAVRQPPTFLTILPSSNQQALPSSAAQERATPTPSPTTLSPTFSNMSTKSGQSPPAADSTGLDYFNLLLSWKSSDRDPPNSKNILIESTSENVYSFLRFRREEMSGKSLSSFIQTGDLSKFINLFTGGSSAASSTSPNSSSSSASFNAFKQGATAAAAAASTNLNTGSPSSPSTGTNKQQHRTFTCHMLTKPLLSPTSTGPSPAIVLGEPPGAKNANKSLKSNSSSSSSGGGSTSPTSLLPSSGLGQPQYEPMTITAGQTTVSSNDKKETVLCLVQMNKVQQTLQIPHPISIKTPPLPQIYQSTCSTTSPLASGSGGGGGGGASSASTSPTQLNMPMLPASSGVGGIGGASYDCNMDQIITKMTRRGIIVWTDMASLKSTSFINNIPNGVDGIKSGLLFNVKMGKITSILDFVHNNDLTHVNKHISDVCSKRENISAIYRLKISDKHAFVYTNSKLIDEMIDPNLQVDENEKTLIYSVHSIIKEIDSEVEMKGNASTSLMKTLISKKPSSANSAAAAVKSSLLMTPASPSGSSYEPLLMTGPPGGPKRTKSSSSSGDGAKATGNLSPKSAALAKAAAASASSSVAPIGAKFAFAMLGLNTSTNNPNVNEKVQRLSETLLETSAKSKAAGAAFDPSSYSETGERKSGGVMDSDDSVPIELNIKAEKLDHFDMQHLQQQSAPTQPHQAIIKEENEYKEGILENDMRKSSNESSQMHPSFTKSTPSRPFFYNDAPSDLKPSSSDVMDHQTSLNELDLNSTSLNLNDHDLEGKENDEFESARNRRLDKSLENELRSKLETSLLTTSAPSSTNFTPGKEENILRALLDAKEPEQTVITLDAIGGSVFKNKYSRANSINSGMNKTAGFVSSMSMEGLKSPSLNFMKKSLFDAELSMKFAESIKSPGFLDSPKLEGGSASSALTRLSSLAESDSFMDSNSSPKQAAKKKKTKATKPAQDKQHGGPTAGVFDQQPLSAKIKYEMMPSNEYHYDSNPHYNKSMSVSNTSNNNNNSLLKQMLDGNSNSVAANAGMIPSNDMYFGQQPMNQMNPHMPKPAGAQGFMPNGGYPNDRQFSNQNINMNQQPQQQQQYNTAMSQDISIGININEFTGTIETGHGVVDENDDVLNQLDQVFTNSADPSAYQSDFVCNQSTINKNTSSVIAGNNKMVASSTGLMVSMYSSSDPSMQTQQQQVNSSQFVGMDTQSSMNGGPGAVPPLQGQFQPQMPPLQVQVNHSSMAYSAGVSAQSSPSSYSHQQATQQMSMQQQMMVQRFGPAAAANEGLIMNHHSPNQPMGQPGMNHASGNMGGMNARMPMNPNPAAQVMPNAQAKDDDLTKQRRIEAITKHLKTDLIESFKSVTNPVGNGPTFYIDDNNNSVNSMMDEQMNDARRQNGMPLYQQQPPQQQQQQQQLQMMDGDPSKQLKHSSSMIMAEEKNVPNVTIGSNHSDPMLYNFNQQNPRAQPPGQGPQFFARRGSGAGFATMLDEAGNECDANGNRLNPGQNNLMKKKLQSCLLNKNVVSGGQQGAAGAAGMVGLGQNPPVIADQGKQVHMMPNPSANLHPQPGANLPNSVNVAVVNPQIVQPPPYQTPGPNNLMNPHFSNQSPNKPPKSVPSPINADQMGIYPPQIQPGGLYKPQQPPPQAGQQPNLGPGSFINNNQQQASIMTTQLTHALPNSLAAAPQAPPTTTTTTTVTVTTQHYNPAMSMPTPGSMPFNSSAPPSANPALGQHPSQSQIIHHHNQVLQPNAPPSNVIYHVNANNNPQMYPAQQPTQVPGQAMQPGQPPAHMINNKPMQTLAPNANPYQTFDNMNNGGYFNQAPQQSFGPNTSPQPSIQGPNHGFMNPAGNDDLDGSQMMFKSSNPMKQNQNDFVKKQLGSAVSKRITQQSNKPEFGSEPYMMNASANGANQLMNGGTPPNQGQFVSNQMDMNNAGAANFSNQISGNIYTQANAPNANFSRTLSPSMNAGMQAAQQNPSFYGSQFQPQFNSAPSPIQQSSFNNQGKPGKTAPYQQHMPQQRLFDNSNNNQLGDQQLMVNQQQFNNGGMNGNPTPQASANMGGMGGNMDQLQGDPSLDLISGEFDFTIDAVTATGNPNSMGMDDSFMGNKPAGYDDMAYGYQPIQGQPSPMKPSSHQMFGQDTGFSDQQYQQQQQQQQQMHGQPMAPVQQDYVMAQQQQQQPRFNQFPQPMNQHNPNVNSNNSSLKLLLD